MPIPYRLNPLGISVREELPLTFTAVVSSTVKLTATGSPTVAGLHYRLGTSGPWIAYTIGDTISLAAGEKVQFWNAAETLSFSASSYVRVVMTGRLTASGNIQSLLNFSSICQAGSFVGLFSGQSALMSGPDILATSIGSSALYQTFANCSNLATFGKFAATSVNTYSCYQMLINCSALEEFPGLKMQQLASNSFSFCFYNCSKLRRLEVDFTSWGNETTNWVSGVAAEGTFIKPAALPEEYGPNRIPSGWTVVNK